MSRKDILGMTLTELKRLELVQSSFKREITQKSASEVLGISERQLRRVLKSYRSEGAKGLIHKGRGKRSNRETPSKTKKETLGLYKKKYNGFGPTLASEKLLELDGLSISRETLRQWLLSEGLWQSKRKVGAHRKWRERKECLGEMVQMDGSHHDWLEGRGPSLVLMGYIDDATNEVYGRFYDYEGTMPAMESFKGYAKKYGLPQSIYIDKHSTYKSTKKQTVEEELSGTKPMSEFERALFELGVEVIHAHSPQAKGRIERLFGTFQDRVVKEMRLRKIKSKEEANTFLKGYLPQYNKRFRVSPVGKADIHRKLPRQLDLDRYLCLKTERTVKKDHTISYQSRLFQIKEPIKTKKVIVEETFKGKIRITSNGLNVKHNEIFKRPLKETAKRISQKKTFLLPKDHPWRKFEYGQASPEKLEKISSLKQDISILQKVGHF